MGLKVQKEHLQTMEFKVKRNCQQITHFSLSSHHEKISLGSNFDLAHKQTKQQNMKTNKLH